MQLNLKLFKFKFNETRFKRLQSELTQIHGEACLKWLGAVLEADKGYSSLRSGPGLPVFSGESLGSLYPAAIEIDKTLGGTVAQEVLGAFESMHPQQDMARMRPSWRYVHGKHGTIKSLEYGKTEGSATMIINFKKGFNFKFKTDVYQWGMAERRGLGKMSPWLRFEAGREAYKEAIRTEIRKIWSRMYFRTLVQVYKA